MRNAGTGSMPLRALSTGEGTWSIQRTFHSGLASKPGPVRDGKIKCLPLRKTDQESKLLKPPTVEGMNEGMSAEMSRS